MNFNAPVVTMLFAAICGVLLIVLALNIVRLRRSHRVSFGRFYGSLSSWTSILVLSGYLLVRSFG